MKMKNNICGLFFRVLFFLFLSASSLWAAQWKDREKFFFEKNLSWFDLEKNKKSLFHEYDRLFFKSNESWKTADKDWFVKNKAWMESEKENN